MRVCTAKIRSPYPNSNSLAAFLPPPDAPLVGISPPAPDSPPSLDIYLDMAIPTNPATSPPPLGHLLRRSTFLNCETWTNTRYQDEVFYSSIVDL